MKLLWESQHTLKMNCLCGRSDIERSTREKFFRKPISYCFCHCLKFFSNFIADNKNTCLVMSNTVISVSVFCLEFVE